MLGKERHQKSASGDEGGGGGEVVEGGGGGEGAEGRVEQVWEAAAAVAPENVGQNKQIGKHRVWWGGN